MLAYVVVVVLPVVLEANKVLNFQNKFLSLVFNQPRCHGNSTTLTKMRE